MTPKEAILVQCRFCLNTATFRGCNCAGCKLNDQSLSRLKRIKAHCLNCIGASSIQAVRKCDGKITNPDAHICSLHPYRLGHNPNRRGIGGKNPNSRAFLGLREDDDDIGLSDVKGKGKGAGRLINSTAP